MDWKKGLIVGVGAAGAAAVVYYLLKENGKAKALPVDSAKKAAGDKKAGSSKPKVSEITKEQVSEILQDIIRSQEQMKGYMKDLTKELTNKSTPFEQTYKRVKELQPSDPLEKFGLSMMDFDQLLDRHQNEPQVREAIGKIMGAPSPKSCASDKVQSITVKKLIEVHNFMLAELEELVNNFQKLPNKDTFDMKTVTIAAQAVVGSKIETKFSLSSEDIEGAVMLHHTSLASDQEFSAINIKIQHTMGKLMGGSPFSG